MRLIDADALIAHLHNTTFCDGDDRPIVYKVVENEITIDPVKRGEWLKYPGEVVSDDGLWGETLFDCSNCGHTVHVATRFCSQCGARMGSVKWRSEDAAN